jgi:hypothetical protein
MQDELSANQLMALLSSEDQELATRDLVALGMFTVVCDHRGARRVDPKLVRAPKMCGETPDDYAVGFNEARGGQSIGTAGITWRARADRERKPALRWGEIVLQMSRDPMIGIWSSSWRWAYDKLPIWRKMDPGAL